MGNNAGANPTALNTGGIPLRIKTMESASTEQLCENVMTNLSLIDRWIGPRYAVHGGKAVVFSAGDSFTKNPKAGFDKVFPHPHNSLDTQIFCVKHALPSFDRLNRKPDFCVVLDPRAVDGISTLGHKRSTLFRFWPQTTYLVASMTHHSVTKFLLENGANVVGWHSACEATKQPDIQKLNLPWIGGGSCSAMRAFIIAYVFGYRNIGMLGFDSTIPEPKEYAEDTKFEQGLHQSLSTLQERGFSKQPLSAEETEALAGYIQTYMNRQAAPKKPSYMKLNIGGTDHFCTPELAAQVQDIERLFQQNRDVCYTNFSGGACKSVWEAYGGEENINPPEFWASFNAWKGA